MEIVDVISISDETATVTWNPPIHPNGILTGYEVKYSVYEDPNDTISVSVTTNIYSMNMTDLGK